MIISVHRNYLTRTKKAGMSQLFSKVE